MREYDPDLYRVARLGRFGLNGRQVLPQFEVAKSHAEVIAAVKGISEKFRFCGMDFGFEESYNAVIKCAVDDAAKVLYIYYEYYKNKMTDDKTEKELKRMDWTRYKSSPTVKTPRPSPFIVNPVSGCVGATNGRAQDWRIQGRSSASGVSSAVPTVPTRYENFVL